MYASDDASEMVKNEYIDTLNDIICNVGNQREIIILGDLNARVEKKINYPVIGRHEEETVNDNSERLRDVFRKQFRIMNGFLSIKTYTNTRGAKIANNSN